MLRSSASGSSPSPRATALLEIFRSLGVKGLVPGGQTFNPSAEEILAGIRQRAGRRGHRPAEQQERDQLCADGRTRSPWTKASRSASTSCRSESPLQGFTALVAFDRDVSLEENVETMTEEGAVDEAR